MSRDETIFAEVIRLASAAERSAYLDRACAGDAELRRNVEELMLAHERAGGFLEAPPRGIEAIARDDPDAADQPAEQIGTIVGPYRLLEQLGEGGMGVVFMAEQIRPVRRHVALKIIKPGMDTKQVIARFEAERQALAMMDHANIARVFDVGTTASGRPYFAMELVKGIPITDYCDQNQLPPEQRLGLFVQVCRAVQHAHQKGIIHRDLKPSNVLVTLHDGTPVPKIIDFGVAKAVASAGPLTDRTLFTHFAQMVGTPLYMSPEQAELSGLDIDTRADVYALGVLLYELLTGTTPFDRARLGQAAYDEIRRIIREEDPPKPSTRLSTLLGETLSAVSSRRGTDPKRLGRLVHGELDWIVMKAMEKDRSRRYETASAFAADVLRYLASEPVEASPPSRAYRARKFARRNKVAMTTASVVLVVLLSGTIVSTWQAVRATRAEQRAQAGAAIANAVAEFLNHDLLAQANPENEPDRDVKLRTVLDRAAEQIETRFDRQPLVEAAVRRTIGLTYHTLGELPKAEHHLKRALELLQSARGNDHPDTLDALMHLGINYEQQGRYAEAEQLFRRALQAQRRTLGQEHPDTLRSALNLTNCMTNQSRYAEAEQLYRDVLPVAVRVLGESNGMTITARLNLADLYCEMARYADAHALFVLALQNSEDALGSEHPNTLNGIGGLARTLSGMGRTAEAESLYDKLLQTRTRVLGPEHPDTLVSMHNLAGLHREQGRLEEAEKASVHIIEVRRRVLGDEHLNTLKAISMLASVYQDQGRIEEAEGLLIDTLPVHRRVLGPEHPSTLKIMADLLHGYNLIGRDTEAEALGTDLLATIRRVMGEDHPNTLSVRNSLACAFANQGKGEEAEPLLRESIEGQTRILGAEHFNTLWTRQLLSMVLIQQHRYAEAESIAAETLEICRRALGDKHRATAQAEQFLAMAYGNWASDLLTREDVSARDPQRALELSRRSVELMPGSSWPWQVLGLAQLHTGDHRSAIESVEKSCALQSDHPGGDGFQWLVLAMAHKHLNDDDRARAWYTAACQWLQQHPPADAANQSSAARMRAEAAALLGLPEQWPAADWRVGAADLQVYQRMLELNPEAAWAKQASLAAQAPAP